MVDRGALRREEGRSPGISVVIPCFNAAATLSQALASLAAQEGADAFEVVVVDNGSTDRTNEIACQWEGQFEHFQIIRADASRGAGYARNTGFLHAVGDVVLFCDADDVPGRTWVADISAPVRLGQAEIVSGQMETQSLNPVTASNDGGVVAGGYTCGGIPVAFSGNLGVRRQAFWDVGGFDESLVWQEDADFSIRAFVKGYELLHSRATVALRKRSTTPASFKQFHGYAYWHEMLYVRHGELWRERATVPPIGEYLRALLAQLLRISRLTDGHLARRHYMEQLGMKLGRVQGALWFRVLKRAGSPRLLGGRRPC